MSLNSVQENYIEQARTSFEIALDAHEWPTAYRILEEVSFLGYATEIAGWKHEYIAAKMKAKAYGK